MDRTMQLRKLVAYNRAHVGIVYSRAATDDAADELTVYGPIDAYDGINARMIYTALAKLDGKRPLNIVINSPGGDVFEGRAISNLLREYAGRKTVRVDGLAASAATTVALAGDEIVMSAGAMWMIHNAWALVMGDREDLLSMAAALEKIDDVIAADYAQRTGRPRDEMLKLMNDETWLSAEEAVEMGFADRVADVKAKNAIQWDLSAYRHAPVRDAEPARIVETPTNATAEAQASAEHDLQSQLQADRARVRLWQLTARSVKGK